MTALPLTVFDVNETVLDLKTMQLIFQRIIGEINCRHRKVLS
jgi:hypothetical protein